MSLLILYLQKDKSTLFEIFYRTFLQRKKLFWLAKTAQCDLDPGNDREGTSGVA